MRNYTFPHAPIDVLDESSALRESKMQRCLHRPLMFVQSAKGTPYIPVWMSGAEAVKALGLETFDMFDKYYHNEQYFLENAIFPYQGAYIVRLPDPDAKKASLVVELQVTEADITQYERDANGAIIKDAQGAPRPLLDNSNQIITEPGYKFKFVQRQLAANEKPGNIAVSTVDIGGVITTTYPLFDAQATSVGSPFNETGIRMYYDYTEQDEDIIAANGALLFGFQPVKHADSSSIVTAIRDIYGAVSVQFAAKPNVKDTRVQMRMSFNDRMDKNYYDPIDKIETLPYKVNLYSDNFKTVGDLVAAVELLDQTLVDGWMVNIFTGLDLNGNPYPHVEIDRTGDAVILNQNYTLYLSGGTDGDISRAKFEERIRAYLNGDMYPEIVENLRYPFTHIYDTGYSYETKVAILLFMSQRDDFRPSMSAQDCNMEANTREEDQSLGAAVRAKALLTPESLLFGTPCCRAEVYCHAGYATNPEYKNLLPLTYWAATRRAQTQSGLFMRYSLGGQPISIVDMVQKINYTEYDPKMKQLKFDTGLNYVQYADEEKIFFPDIRSVYTNTTSVLAGTTYMDALIYLKYICRYVWARYSGKDCLNVEEMYQNIGREIMTEAYNQFGTMYRCVAVVDQTEEMMKVGDTIRVTCDLWGSGVLRVMKTVIVAKRINFSTPSANA